MNETKTTMIKTSMVLAGLPEIHKKYLDNLRNTMRKAEQEKFNTMYAECKSCGRGYIKALENTGMITQAGFRLLYCWFTL